jgi:diguanylate cyclase (GGDEF)-like protein
MNLRRIVEDSLRIEQGLARLEDLLVTERERDVALLLVDLDNSAAVRREGIEAKVSLVTQAVELLRSQVPSDSLVLDSGTRDETLVACPGGDEAAGLELAQRLLEAVRSHSFKLPSGRSVRLTASIGVAVRSDEARAFDLSWAAAQAMREAKQRGDTAAVFRDVGREVSLLVLRRHVAALHVLASSLGRSPESVVREAITRLLEKHGGMWYWAVERGGVAEDAVRAWSRS